MNEQEQPAVAGPVEPTVRPIRAGDIVRLKDPSMYVASFAKKVENRDAVVLWVGPRAHGMFDGKARVQFLKRNGRGKVFEEVLRIEDLELKSA